MGKCGKLSAKEGLFLLAALFWCAFLVDSNSGYEPYLLVAAAGFLLFASSANREPFAEKGDRIAACVLSIMLSACVALANYALFPVAFSSMWGILLTLLFLMALLAGGYFLFRQIFDWIYANAQKTPTIAQVRDGRVAVWVFVCTVVGVAAVDCIFLFGVLYPGLLSPDSMNQIGQVVSGVYSNHHPYFHTQVIRFCLLLGEWVFGSLTAGVATYSVLSILFVSVVFGYAVCTIYQHTGSLKLASIIFGWYLVMPFHILYSVTMWKDVPFGAMSLLFAVGVFRLMKGMGRRRWLNYLAVILGSAGLCLFRSNGFLAFAVSVAFFLLFFGKRNGKLAFLLVAILCGCFVLKHPVLKALHVSQPDPIESLSVPVQQIGCAISEGASLTEGQYDLLSQIVDVERIGEKYLPWISDPLKNLVREKNNQQYLSSHKAEFVKLYVELGLQNPLQYIKGWIELTKGYWNGGYQYWVWWSVGVEKNAYGIVSNINSQWIEQFLLNYLSFWEAPLVRSFLYTGLYSWLMVFAAYSAWVKRDWLALYLTVFPFAVILTLLVATPVFAEFRYVYSVVCTVPVILTVSFWPKAREKE